jgi:glucokinase
MSDKKYYIGIDVGGTKTNIGIIDEEGTILISQKFVTDNGRGDSIQAIENIIYSTKKVITEYSSFINISSIGIGIPGTVERKEGVVLFAPNLGWKNVPIKKMFLKAFNLPIYVGQDTEAAALGEYLCGAGRGMKDIACITIGTGVGCGLVIGGRIHKGKYFTAGELGHTIVELEGLSCNCGRKGCLEAYASGTAIQKRFKVAVKNDSESTLIWRKGIDEVTTEDIFYEAKQGDKLALSLINEAVDYLSMGMTNLINLMCPEAVILSGGISNEEELFINPVIEKTYSRIYNLLVHKVKISKAVLGEFAPLVGGAMFFKDPLFSQAVDMEGKNDSNWK